MSENDEFADVWERVAKAWDEHLTALMIMASDEAFLYPDETADALIDALQAALDAERERLDDMLDKAVDAKTEALEERDRSERLAAALKPFVFSADELYETQSFRDDEVVFMRPDDGNGSVKNGWWKLVHFADVRRAADALAQETSDDTE